MKKEIQMRGEKLPPDVQFESIFLGGGTPSLLSPEMLSSLLKTLSENFDIVPDAETTLEVNPGTVSAETFTALYAAGINRVSIGVQSFFDDELQFLSRIHTADDARRCIADAQKAGFTNISIDLIFALPFHTQERWHSTLEQAVATGVQHLSCYSLIVEPQTPLFEMVQQGVVTPLDGEKEAELYLFTVEYLQDAGYEQYEVSNFSRPGFRCVHNCGYWRGEPYLGFGPSAHSYWNDERWWNISDVVRYCALIEANAFPLGGGEHLTLEEKREECIFLGLRSEGIDFARYKSICGEDFLERYEHIVQQLIEEGLAQCSSSRLQLTPRGYALCDEICQRLL